MKCFSLITSEHDSLHFVCTQKKYLSSSKSTTERRASENNFLSLASFVCCLCDSLISLCVNYRNKASIIFFSEGNLNTFIECGGCEK